MSPTNIELLKQELIRDEDLRTSSYLDTEGYWTIGVGHLLGRSPANQGLVWTVEKCYNQLDLDIQEAMALVSTLPNGAHQACNTDARQRALTNMAFELGERLLTFNTFLSLLGQGKCKEAGEDLKTTLWAHQVPARSSRVIAMIQNG